MSVLSELQQWYWSQADGYWEELYGVEMDSVEDPPGWRVKIDLAETPLESYDFKRLEINRTDDDWLHCWVEDSAFHASGGPINLEEILRVFLDWAKTAPPEDNDTNKEVKYRFESF